MQDPNLFIVSARRAFAALRDRSLRIDPATRHLDEPSRQMASIELDCILNIRNPCRSVIQGVAAQPKPFHHLPREGQLPLPGGPVMRFDLIGRRPYEAEPGRYVCFDVDSVLHDIRYGRLLRDGQADVRVGVQWMPPSRQARKWRRSFGACPILISFIRYVDATKAAA